MHRSRNLIGYLDEAARIAAEGKRASYEALGIATGMRVLDVGCGTGDDARAVAEIVGPSGRCVGVDASSAMVDEARRRGGPPHVEFLLAPADALPFDDASFDAVRAERVFQHLRQPDAAARESFRVLARGGRVLLLDQDWETLVVAGAGRAATRRILNAFADRLANGWAGRNQYATLKRAGFGEVAVTPFFVTLPFGAAYALLLDEAVEFAKESGAVGGEEADEWVRELLAAQGRGEFYCAFGLFAAIGRKPPDGQA